MYWLFVCNHDLEWVCGLRNIQNQSCYWTNLRFVCQVWLESFRILCAICRLFQFYTSRMLKKGISYDNYVINCENVILLMSELRIVKCILHMQWMYSCALITEWLLIKPYNMIALGFILFYESQMQPVNNFVIPPETKLGGGGGGYIGITCRAVRLFTSCSGHNFITTCPIWVIFSHNYCPCPKGVSWPWPKVISPR